MAQHPKVKKCVFMHGSAKRTLQNFQVKYGNTEAAVIKELEGKFGKTKPFKINELVWA